MRRAALMGLQASACFLFLTLCKDPDKERVELLIRRVESQDPSIVDAGLQELHDMGPRAEKAVPAVTKVLTEGHPALRPGAAVALAALDPEGRMCVEALTQTLSDPAPNVRAHAARALGMLMRKPESAMVRLRNLERDPEKSVQAHAARTLARFEPDNPAHRELLVKIASTGNPPERALAVGLWGEIASSLPVQDLSVIERALNDEERLVRQDGVAAAARLGPRAAPLLPALVRAFESKDEVLARRAVSALNAVDPSGEKLVVHLRRTLYSPDVRVRLESATALGTYGKKGLPAVVDLKSALRDPDSGVRRQAARSLGKIGPETEAADSLSLLLEDSSTDTAWVAAEALAQMGEAALPHLKRSLADSRREMRLRAAYGLSRMSPRSPEVRGLLEKAALDSDAEVKSLAQNAIATTPAR